MDDFEGVIGYFHSTEAFRAAVRKARSEWFQEVETYLPVGDEVTIEEVIPGVSIVPWAALFAALGGGAFGLWLAIWTSWDYPLVTGGMPITSFPPFLVVAFEVLILAAAGGAILGFVWQAGLPKLKPGGGYSSDLAVDTLALLIRCSPHSTDRARAESVLRETGAFDVRSVHQRQCGPLGEAA